MLRFLTGATVVCLLLGLTGPVLAEDTAQGIIDKAVKAHGGAEKLAKFKAVQTSGKGTIEVMGTTLSFTAEGAAQMPDKFKSALHLEIAGMKVGGRRQLVVPPDLAYGPAGSGHRLSGRTLIFVIDLLGVS